MGLQPTAEKCRVPFMEPEGLINQAPTKIKKRNIPFKLKAISQKPVAVYLSSELETLDYN